MAGVSYNQYGGNSQWQQPQSKLQFPVPNNRQHYYNLEQTKTYSNNRNYNCDACSKSFFSKAKYNAHINEHVDCPFPECGLKAHIKVIDKHISNQHMLVNFEALQMDDEAWIAERKKRFPTAERVELRRKEIQEKLERGERMGMDKKKKKNNDGQGKKWERGKPKRNRQDKRGQDNKRSFPLPKKIIVDLFEEDDTERFGVKAFAGTKQFYEDEGEVSYFGGNNNHIETKDIIISDEEDWESQKPTENNYISELKLTNALGSLMGAYTDSEEEIDTIEAKNPMNSENVPNKVSFSKAPSNDGSSLNTISKAPILQNKDVTNNENSNGDVLPKSMSNTDENIDHKKIRRTRKRCRNMDKGDKSSRASKKPYIRKRKLTLLQKLLEPDIRHERNIILQCARHIVQNNFFNAQ